MVCVADGICLSARNGGCTSLRVAACRAKYRSTTDCFTGPGWPVPFQVNQVQGKGFLLCPGSIKVYWKSIPEHKAVKAPGVGAHQAVPRLALLRGNRAKEST